MQREGIAGRYVLRQGSIPSDDRSRAGKIQSRRRQRRHVQRLADMANRIGPTGVLVE
jgi:hypothetical protein